VRRMSNALFLAGSEDDLELFVSGTVGVLGSGGSLEAKMFNPFLAISFQAARLGWETQNVMALRLMRWAGGGLTGQSEAHPVDTEKRPALTDVQAAGAAVAVKGRNGHVAVKGRNGHAVASKKVTRVHKKPARRSKRRLSR
jgi:hypothetical protein